MADFVDILIFVAMGLLLIVLIGGLVTLWRGEEASRSRSNQLMRMRVVIQFIVICLLAASVFLFDRDPGPQPADQGGSSTDEPAPSQD